MENVKIYSPEINQRFNRNLLQTPMPKFIYKMFTGKEIFSLQELWLKKYKEMLGLPEQTIAYRFNLKPCILNDSCTVNLRGTNGL